MPVRLLPHTRLRTGRQAAGDGIELLAGAAHGAVPDGPRDRGSRAGTGAYAGTSAGTFVASGQVVLDGHLQRPAHGQWMHAYIVVNSLMS